MNWNRKRWGVEFSSPLSKPCLIGSLWNDELTHLGKYYDGEPPRALLFTNRKLARDWCKAEQAKYAHRNDVCADWRFRPVRVRETVRKV